MEGRVERDGAPNVPLEAPVHPPSHLRELSCFSWMRQQQQQQSSCSSLCSQISSSSSLQPLLFYVRFVPSFPFLSFVGMLRSSVACSFTSSSSLSLSSLPFPSLAGSLCLCVTAGSARYLLCLPSHRHRSKWSLLIGPSVLDRADFVL